MIPTVPIFGLKIDFLTFVSSAVGYAYWMDERQRRRHNGLPARRTKKNKDKVPSYFYTTRIRNPPDVTANESPIFGEDQQIWKGTQVLREHVQSDAHASSELRKWWFTRHRKSIVTYYCIFHTGTSYTHFISPI